MRIEGYFGRYGAPYTDAVMICEGLDIEESVKFLVDTGASKTTISESDAIRLKINYDDLQKLETGMIGIGGVVDTYSIKGLALTFVTDEGSHAEQISEILAIKHSVKNKGEEERMKLIPSLLGRDLLDKFSLIIDKTRNTVLITDEEVRVQPV